MDAEIIKCIEARREYLYRHYDLPEEGRRKFEALFARMALLGGECSSRDEFEKTLATMPMNRELYGLMADYAIYAKPDAGNG
jgi:hypothetical protein